MLRDGRFWWDRMKTLGGKGADWDAGAARRSVGPMFLFYLWKRSYQYHQHLLSVHRSFLSSPTDAQQSVPPLRIQANRTNWLTHGALTRTQNVRVHPECLNRNKSRIDRREEQMLSDWHLTPRSPVRRTCLRCFEHYI